MNLLRCFRLTMIVVAGVVSLGCNDAETGSVTRARQAMTKGDYAAAVIDLKTALQRAPNDAELRYLLGLSLMEQGNTSAALVEFGKAKDAGYDEELLIPKFARALALSERWKELQDNYGKVRLRSDAAQAELNVSLAMALAVQGKQAEATRLVDEALRTAPRLGWAMLNKARFLIIEGHIDEALRLLEQAKSNTDIAGEANLLRGMILQGVKKDPVGAAQAYQEATKDPKVALSAFGALLMGHVSKGDLPAAKAILEQLKKSYPKSAAVVYFDAVVAYASKDFARAEGLADQLLRVAPGSGQLLLLAGASSLQRGAFLAAEAKLGRAVQLPDVSARARKLLAEIYLRLGQPEKSISMLRPLLESDPPDSQAQALAGQAYLRLGSVHEAESMLAAALKSKPADAQIRTALALTDMLKGDFEGATSALKSISAADPGDTADLALISVKMRRDELDAALEAIAALEKKQPSSAAPRHLRGVALLRKGDFAGARAAFESALAAEPLHYASTRALVDLDLNDNKLDDAKRRLEAAIRLNPKNTAARLALVAVLSRQGVKTDALLAVLDEAIKFDPNDPTPRVAKISLLSRAGGGASSAVAAARDALAALPQDPEVLDAAGLAFAAAGGDDQQALSAFNKLAASMPRSPMPQLRLADVYGKRGDSAAMRQALSRAVEIAPQSEDVLRRVVADARTSKDFKFALDVARDLKQRFPNLAVGDVLQGDVEAARKAWPAAIAAYRAGLGKVDPRGRAAVRLHAALIQQGDKQAASKFASDWLKSNPTDPVFREYLAGIALVAGNAAVAERLYREVTALQPLAGPPWNNLAWVLAQKGDPGAVAAAERAYRLAPSDAAVMDTMAKAMGAAGRLDEALMWQRRALARQPDRADFRIQYAKLLSRAGKRTEALAELDSLAKAGGAPAQREEINRVREQLAH